MKVYLNRSQLARLLNIAPKTLALRIAAGKFKPDAKDGLDADLFEKSKHDGSKARKVLARSLSR